MSREDRSRVERDRHRHTYAPSWFDRLSAWINTRKTPSWLIYLLIPFIWLLATALAQWLNGGIAILDWDPITFVAIFQIGYMLFIIQFLDKQALQALDEVKPALGIESEDYPDLQRLISTLPARPTILVSFLSGMIGLLLVVVALSGTDLDSTISVTKDLFGIAVATTMTVLWVTNGLFVYHTYHQLNVTHYILTNLVVVHPFYQRELFSFSSFSAKTAIAIVLLTPLWIVFDPGSVSLVISILFAVFGLIAFLSPLIGVHNILVREKEKLRDENAKQFEKSISRLMTTLQQEELEGLDQMDKSLTSLKKAREQIEAISTWPWRIETLRQILAAIFLPIIIWLLQYFLSRALGS